MTVNNELNELRARVRALISMKEDLRVENEDLRLKLARLESQLKISEEDARENIGLYFGLSVKQSQFFDLLLRFEVVTPKLVQNVLHGGTVMSGSLYEVMVTKMRQKVGPKGITIHTVRHRGWRIKREDRDKAFCLYRGEKPPCNSNHASP